MRILLIIALAIANAIVWTAIAVPPPAPGTVIYKQEDREELRRLLLAIEQPVISWDI